MSANLSVINATTTASPHPTDIQLAWLKRGLNQPGGKLPLFDEWGQKVSERTIRSCIDHGWAEPWFTNPLKPDWLVCKLTATGRGLVSAS
jgi:hypothetical protein